jgi:hypothetical protein
MKRSELKEFVKNCNSAYDMFSLREEIIKNIKNEELKQKLMSIDSMPEFFAYKKQILKDLGGEIDG